MLLMNEFGLKFGDDMNVSMLFVFGLIVMSVLCLLVNVCLVICCSLMLSDSMRLLLGVVCVCDSVCIGWLLVVILIFLKLVSLCSLVL